MAINSYAISDRVKFVIAKDMIVENMDPADTRSFSLILTSEGKKIAKKASLFASCIEQPLEKPREE